MHQRIGLQIQQFGNLGGPTKDPWLSCIDLPVSNLGAVHHPGFKRKLFGNSALQPPRTNAPNLSKMGQCERGCIELMIQQLLPALLQGAGTTIQCFSEVSGPNYTKLTRT